MALKDTWVDKKDGIDINSASHINEVAAAVIDLENEFENQSFTEGDPTVPAWAKQPQKPSYTKSEVGLGNVDNVKQYSVSNPPPYPVTKVNGKTGAVVLDAEAVGARANTWLPTFIPEGRMVCPQCESKRLHKEDNYDRNNRCYNRLCGESK